MRRAILESPVFVHHLWERPCSPAFSRSPVLAVVCVSSGGAADNWPQWRGPKGTGVAAEGDYPVKFSTDEGVAWKVDVPGRGISTPTVWGDAIFVTCGIDGQDGVSATTERPKRWRKTLGPERAGKHRNGSGSNPSPVTDGKHVVAYFKSGRVACLDLAGNEIWQVNLQEKYGKDTLVVGPGHVADPGWRARWSSP